MTGPGIRLSIGDEECAMAAAHSALRAGEVFQKAASRGFEMNAP